MADARVQEAQDWVNATYGTVAGFVKAPLPTADNYGRTGWSTIYPLTRALQYELGISPLTDNFGPQTLAKLSARGGIKTTETNRNIIKILGYACFCKGYGAGAVTGEFHADLAAAIQEMLADMGVDTALNGAVPPKVVKALLNMDAYTLTSGGTTAVQAAQRWLNNRYIGRQDFFYIPCDGNFSRDVQKALVFGIQYELGMADGTASGSIGDATRAGLKTKTLTIGSTGAFVNLFTAALVFNKLPKAIMASTYAQTPTADVVLVFQKATVLPESARNGNGNYQTWMELLVSTGDPTRDSAGGCDTSTEVTDARAKALKANGYRVIGRYLDNVTLPPGSTKTPLPKKINPGELQTIFTNGLKVFPISQYDGGSVDSFTFATGYRDSQKAHDAALGYKFNPGTVIYFAVDYDATQSEIESNIIPYFHGVFAGLQSRGKRYVHGVYGSRNVCSEVTRVTGARWSFVSGMSTGFSGNLGFPHPSNWSFNQIQTLTVGSSTAQIEIDKSVWKPNTDPGVGSVGATATSMSAFLAYIKRVYDVAAPYHAARPNEIAKAKSVDMLVLDYLRYPTYTNQKWRDLIGIEDGLGIQYLISKLGPPVDTITDPTFGIDYRVDHFAATTYAHNKFKLPAGVSVSVGDIGGWGGDLLTFFGDWRRDSDSIASGRVYAEQRLGKVSLPVGVTSTFMLVDLIMDADGFNIARQLGDLCRPRRSGRRMDWKNVKRFGLRAVVLLPVVPGA